MENLINSLNKKRWGRFITGSIVGIIPAFVYWGYAIFFHANIPLTQGIIGSLIIVLVFGIANMYNRLDDLFRDMNF